MTSLDFIMDINPEEPPHDNKKDGGGSSTSGPKRDRDLLSASEHANPGDHHDKLNTATARRRGPSGRPPRSSTTAGASSSTSPTGSTVRPAPARGHSNTSSSNEGMDRYGSHASGSGGQQPSRPLGNPSDIPIKLTPITGRVSRAKKGVPVHTCDICRPPKTFTRAEHLRRHQLSHQTPQYPCIYPGCERAFHRADLLARHASRHEQEGDRASGRSTGDNSRRTSATSMSDSYNNVGQGRPSSQGPMPQTPDMSNPGPGYPAGAPYQSYNTQGGGTPMSPPQQPGRRESYQSTSSGPTGGAYTLSTTPQIPTINQPPSMEGSPSAMGYEMVYQSPRTASPNPVYLGAQALPAHLPTLTIPENPGLLAPDVSPWASSESNFSTPSEHSHRKSFAPRGSYGSPTTTADWAMTSYVTGTYPATTQDLHSPEQLDLIAASAAPSFTNPWSSAPYSGPMIDPSMSIYYEDSSLLDHPHPHFPSDPQAHIGRFKEPVALMGTLSGATYLTAITLPRPVRNAIPDLLEVYWKRFDTFFPIVNRRSFEAAPNDVLRCAMAAMATQFLDGKEDRLRGNSLHEFAWQEVKRVPQWSTQIMQAILLCEFFARFRGRKAVIRPSDRFQSLYSRVNTTTTQDPDSSPFGPTPVSSSPAGATAGAALRVRWAEWLEAEARRRLLAACFILDVHTSVYYELPLMQPFTQPCPPIPLTGPSQALWEASTAEEWEARIPTGPASLEPTVLMEGVITPERMASSPPLDQAVFLASEFLRKPQRNGPLDLSKPPDLADVQRITELFPGSPVACTYAALHYTPLHDLLAVSGDSWLFSQKVLPSMSFQQHQKRLRRWSASPHAAVAAQLAAKALVAFVSDNCNNGPSSSQQQQQQQQQQRQASSREGQRAAWACWNSNNISDYWALYVCSLICWALGYQTTRGTANANSGSGAGTPRTVPAASSPLSRSAGGDNHHNTNPQAAAESEAEALGWLRMVAAGGATSTADVLSSVNGRGRGVIVAVVALARRRLEAEAVGGRSRLLVDAVGVLRKLEEGANWKWF